MNHTFMVDDREGTLFYTCHERLLVGGNVMRVPVYADGIGYVQRH